MLNGELCSCFLPQRPAFSCDSLMNSRVDHSLCTGAACNLDLGLSTLVSFLLSLAMFQAVVLLPSLCLVESKGAGGLAVLGRRHRRMGHLVCLVAVLQSSYPQLYCIPACVVAPIRISPGCSSPPSRLLCAVTSDTQGNLLTGVSHPPRCLFLLQKVGGLVIFLLYLPLPTQTPSFLCYKKNTVIVIMSPQEEMRKVWPKAALLEIARSGICLQMHSDCLLGYPEGVSEITGS